MGDEARFFTGLALVALVTCGALWFLGRWLSKRVSKSKESRTPSVTLTRAGYVWVGVQVALMVGAVILIELFPDSAFGRWVAASPVTAVIVFVIACAILGGALGRRGIRLLELKGRDA
jgi:hypothetical protein